jgi:hypothetical protein
MTRSAKSGIASALLLGSIFVPPFSNWRQPITSASIVLSGVLGLLAARHGSKWWLVVPSLIVAGVAIGLYVATHSF